MADADKAKLTPQPIQSIQVLGVSHCHLALLAAPVQPRALPVNHHYLLQNAVCRYQAEVEVVGEGYRFYSSHRLKTRLVESVTLFCCKPSSLYSVEQHSRDDGVLLCHFLSHCLMCSLVWLRHLVHWIRDEVLIRNFVSLPPQDCIRSKADGMCGSHLLVEQMPTPH